MTSIPNCIPFTSGNELKYLEECIETGWISPVGPFVDRFEKEFAGYHCTDSAVAVSSGTDAIHLGLKALGVEKNNYVLCPTITFVGSINPIKYCMADPIFLDVEDHTMNIDPESLISFLKDNTEMQDDKLIFKENKRRISGLIVVHLYGNPARMDKIMKIANEYGIPVLEDVAESLGARHNGKLVGTFGDIGCFSFNGNKVITSGGGGMIISSDPEKLKFCKHISTQAKTDAFEFIHDNIGYNYRLSNLCAAVGTAQLENLDLFISKKRENAEYYKRVLNSNEQWNIVEPPETDFGTYWMTLANRNHNNHNNHNSFIEDMHNLSKRGIGVRPVWYPAHLMPLYQDDINFCDDDKCRSIYQSIVCLPSSVSLTEEEIRRTVNEIISA